MKDAGIIFWIMLNEWIYTKAVVLPKQDLKGVLVKKNNVKLTE